MKPPFEKFHIQVSQNSTLMVLNVAPQPTKTDQCWEIVRWVEDAIREKLEREKEQ